MKKKTTINLDKNSLIFGIKHGKRDKYIENIIKDRTKKLKIYLNQLRTFSKQEIIELLELISLPVGDWETKKPDISFEQRKALIALWHEMKATGSTPEKLITYLDGQNNE